MTLVWGWHPGLISLGLAASTFWGASDFLGGLATRRARVVGVVTVAHGLSLVLLLLIALGTHSSLPPRRFALIGLIAGSFGGVALLLYYKALSLGEMGLTTALTGLISAMVPVGFSFLTQGAPKSTQIAGFVVAAAAIALIAYTPATRPRPLALGLASMAGLGFGGFLVASKIGSAYGLLWLEIFSRMASVTVALTLLVLTWFYEGRKDTGPGKQYSGRPAPSLFSRIAGSFAWIAGSAGVLEATGTLFYMAATREGRLDVAAVLASLYPAVTILLAAWFLKERTTLKQAFGMTLALGAVVLVSI